MIEITKFCKDCRHYQLSRPGEPIGNGECLKTMVRDPVDGLRHYQTCRIIRLPGRRCGPKGRLWEPKEKDAA